MLSFESICSLEYGEAEQVFILDSFFRHSNGKNSCWKTERVQGEKGCWSSTQGNVPQEWAREVEKGCWDREKEENWWPVWEGSEMEAQAVERGQRTTEEELFQINCYPSRQSWTQSDGVAATMKRMTDRLSQGQDIPGGWKLIRPLIEARKRGGRQSTWEALESINTEAPPDLWPSQWAEQYFSSNWKREGWLRLISVHKNLWVILYEYATLYFLYCTISYYVNELLIFK